MRLFIAINFNNEIKSFLAEKQEALKKHALTGSFTLRENMHLTLVFIGETNETTSVCDVMDASIMGTGKSAESGKYGNKPSNLTQSTSRIKPFGMSISGAGCFKRKVGDIWWAGIEDNENLTRLHSRLTDGLLSKGFNIETRKFSPHLTLARQVKLPSGFDRDMLSQGGAEYHVNKISLMKSERLAGKLTYTEIYFSEL